MVDGNEFGRSYDLNGIRMILSRSWLALSKRGDNK